MERAGKGSVVLLHGLGRGPGSMGLIAAVLRRAGWRVVNRGYPSLRLGPEALAGEVGTLLAEGGAAPAVVTHSMGGILLRLWLARHPEARLGRVVILGPPNAGSEVVDWLAARGLAGLLGPAGAALGTGGLAGQLGPVAAELGVIAGRRRGNPLTAPLVSRPSDGTVSVESTRVAGMADHLVLPVTHSGLTVDPLVMAQVLAFLEAGRFEPELGWARALRRVAGYFRITSSGS